MADAINLTNTELAARHAELMKLARAARAENNLDTAQAHLAAIRPLNAEMQRRMGL